MPYNSYLKKSGELGEKKLFDEYYEKEKYRIKSELIIDKYNNPTNNLKDIELKEGALNFNCNIIRGKIQQGELSPVLSLYIFSHYLQVFS